MRVLFFHANKNSGKTADMEKNMVVLEIKDYGTIKIELDEKNAPISSENFKNLVEEGFYDGLTFQLDLDRFHNYLRENS